jgi:hypothetical protein
MSLWRAADASAGNCGRKTVYGNEFVGLGAVKVAVLGLGNTVGGRIVLVSEYTRHAGQCKGLLLLLLLLLHAYSAWWC